MSHKPESATLKDYGRAFQTIPLSNAADQRIRSALDGSPREKHVKWLWAVPVAAACALALLLARGSLFEPSSACEVTRNGDHTRYSGRCIVDLATMALRLEADATLDHHAEEVRLVRGTARFDVRKVPTGAPPVRIEVPEASIEVLGTQFTVTVAAHTSRVQLHEGRVRFLHAGSGTVEMSPGEQLTFENATGRTQVVTVEGLAAPKASPIQAVTSNAAPTASQRGATPQGLAQPDVTDNRAATRQDAPLAPVPPASEASAVSSAANRALQVSRVNIGATLVPSSNTLPSTAPSAAGPSELQHALQLRAQGRYDEALEALENVTATGTRAREVVDFEQATLTELRTPEHACVRYQQHLANFPQSRYRAAVLGKLARCSADQTMPQENVAPLETPKGVAGDR